MSSTARPVRQRNVPARLSEETSAAASAAAEKPKRKTAVRKGTAAAKGGKAVKADKKSAKKAKDPNMPKRALSAFMLFSQHHRPLLVKQKPELKFAEVGKELGDMWKNASTAEKNKFQKLAEAEKARYEKALAAYNAKA